MATAKVTFTLDRDTLSKLADAAARLSRPKSQVVREAIADYYARLGRLSEAERARMLSDFDRLVPAIPNRPAAEVEAELREIRKARKAGGRRQRRAS
jgi:predicted transcriptional regulator